jgi:hypothetical protein
MVLPVKAFVLSTISDSSLWHFIHHTIINVMYDKGVSFPSNNTAIILST